MSGSFLIAQLNTDSLLQLAAGIQQPADRAAQLDDWVAGRSFTDFTDPVALFQARVELAAQRGDVQQEMVAAVDLIKVSNAAGDFARADSLSFHYVATAEQVETPQTRAQLYHEAAKAAYYAQQHALAIRYDSSALVLLPLLETQAERDAFEVRVRSFLGQALSSSGQFVPAAMMMTDAIDLARATEQDSSLLIELYTGLGIVYSQIGLYDRAVQYLDRSTEYSSGMSPGNQVVAEVNTGRNLLLVGNYPAARDRYRKCLRYPLTTPETIATGPYIYNGLVESYYRLGDRDSVNHYYNRYQELLSQHPDQADVNGFLYKQSTWLHHLVNGRLTAAETVGRELLDGARQSNDPADLLLYTEWLAATYRAKKDFERADALTRELMIRKDSVQSANRNNALLLYYNQFETKEKENEILRLNVEQERITARQRLFQTAAGLLALLLLTGGFFFFKLRAARRKLAQRNDELSRLNATKDRFFGIIAHDLRNPIVALQMADRQVGQLYEKGWEAEVREVVGNISDTAGRLSGLLDNLLQWALSQSDAIELKREPLLLAAAAADIVGLYQPAAAYQNITLENTINETTTILADPNALQTILRNLVGNAVKYSGGQEATTTVTLAHHREGEMDVISVRDQGPGLSDDVRDQLFQLHRKSGTTGRRTHGTGLGLILCRDLAELHGGRISVASEAGKGATFSVWLPAS